MDENSLGSNRPEDGQKGSGFGHRRGEAGGRFWRPPENRNDSKVALAKAKPEVRVQSRETGRDKEASVRWRTARPNLHIDDGCMGGGGSVPMQSSTYVNSHDQSGDFNDFGDYRKGPDGIIDTSDDYFTNGRQGIFHYCLMAKRTMWDTDGEEHHVANPSYYEGHILFSVKKYGKDHDTTWIAAQFMHELGHTLDLHGYGDDPPTDPPKRPGYFPGIDMKTSDSDYIYGDYKSCMNYKYSTTFIDYSDGSNDATGVKDHDDWGTINLGYYLDKKNWGY